MNLKQATSAAALAAATLAACTSKQFPTNREIAARLRDNPAAQQRYELTVTLRDAPGAFKYLSFYADYSAPNCSYLISSVSEGAYDTPRATKRFELIQISDTEWKGVFYTDALLDEDYGFDKGVCHWQLDGVAVSFSANGQHEDTLFEVSMVHDEIQAGSPKAFYFNKTSYPRLSRIQDGEAGNKYSGLIDRSLYSPGADLFSATMSIRKKP